MRLEKYCVMQNSMENFLVNKFQCAENLSERAYGLDMLRFISMLGIIGLHVINGGGYLRAASSTTQLIAVRVVLVLCYCSANTFAMLTGYLYASKERHNSTNLISLLAATFFYCVVILTFFICFKPELFQERRLYAYALCPPLMGRYWYLTSYLLLFVMIPYINVLLKTLGEKQFTRMLFLLLLLFSFATTFASTDFFKVYSGYSPVWLVFCYVCGAYIYRSKGRTIVKNKKCVLAMFFVNTAVVVVSCFWPLSSFLGTVELYGYTSPFMLANAAILLVIFSDISIEKRVFRKLTKSLSKCSFGVYIIHSHLLVYDYVLCDAFLRLSINNTLIYTLGLLLSILAIFAVCWPIEELRLYLFKQLGISKLEERFGEKVNGLMLWT